MRADGAQVVSIYIDTFVYQTIVASNVDASECFVRRTKTVIVEEGIGPVGN